MHRDSSLFWVKTVFWRHCTSWQVVFLPQFCLVKQTQNNWRTLIDIEWLEWTPIHKHCLTWQIDALLPVLENTLDSGRPQEMNMIMGTTRNLAGSFALDTVSGRHGRQVELSPQIYKSITNRTDSFRNTLSYTVSKPWLKSNKSNSILRNKYIHSYHFCLPPDKSID